MRYTGAPVQTPFTVCTIGVGELLRGEGGQHILKLGGVALGVYFDAGRFLRDQDGVLFGARQGFYLVHD